MAKKRIDYPYRGSEYTVEIDGDDNWAEESNNALEKLQISDIIKAVQKRRGTPSTSKQYTPQKEKFMKNVVDGINDEESLNDADGYTSKVRQLVKNADDRYGAPNTFQEYEQEYADSVWADQYPKRIAPKFLDIELDGTSKTIRPSQKYSNRKR